MLAVLDRGGGLCIRCDRGDPITASRARWRAGRVQQLTDFKGGAFDPDYSAVGRQIAFDRRFPNGPDPAYTIRFDGSNPTRLPIARRLTPRNLDAGNPDWSPNGKRIVFNSFYEGQSESELYTIRPDTAMHRIHKENKHNYSFDPVWSPDGGRIAFVHTSSTI